MVKGVFYIVHAMIYIQYKALSQAFALESVVQ